MKKSVQIISIANLKNHFLIAVLSIFTFGLSQDGLAQLANAEVAPALVEVGVGDSFTVTVNIDPNNSGISVAQVAMNFDPSIIQVDGVSLSSSSELNVGLPGTTIDNTVGFFFIAGFNFSAATIPFTHVEIDCTALANGSSSLEYELEGSLQTLFAASGDDVTGALSSGLIIVGEQVDCPNLGADFGESCDDNDPNTEDDIVLTDCTCAGTLICQAPFPAVDESSRSTVVGSSNVDFLWDAVPGQIGCQVQVLRVLGTPPYERQSFTTLDEDYDSLSLNTNLFIPGVTHAWRVRCGCSSSPVVAGPFSSWITFVVPSGITLSSFPNPTKGSSTVSFSLETKDRATLEVYDLNGRMLELLFSGDVNSSTPYQFAFDGANLSQGVYIYRLTTTKEVVNEKFIIAK